MFVKKIMLNCSVEQHHESVYRKASIGKPKCQSWLRPIYLYRCTQTFHGYNENNSKPLQTMPAPNSENPHSMVFSSFELQKNKPVHFYTVPKMIETPHAFEEHCATLRSAAILRNNTVNLN